MAIVTYYLIYTIYITHIIPIVLNTLTNDYDKVPAVARFYKDSGVGWIVIGDEV